MYHEVKKKQNAEYGMYDFIKTRNYTSVALCMHVSPSHVNTGKGLEQWLSLGWKWKGKWDHLHDLFIVCVL